MKYQDVINCITTLLHRSKLYFSFIEYSHLLLYCSFCEYNEIKEHPFSTKTKYSTVLDDINTYSDFRTKHFFVKFYVSFSWYQIFMAIRKSIHLILNAII